MKMKTPFLRSVVIISIIALSIIIGAMCTFLLDKADRKNYPREYAEYVEKYADEYAVPEYVIYAVIKYESSFDSAKLDLDGATGLMGITSDEFDSMMKLTKENLSYDALYGPETNIKYGTYYMSLLFNKFEKWKTAYCAKVAGGNAADVWLSDSSNFDEDGNFVRVPDDNAVAGGEKIAEYAEKYKSLYYSE